jgi:hypothetical protein
VSISLAVVTVQFAARLLSINLIRHAHFGTSERPAESGCEPRSTSSQFYPLRCGIRSQPAMVTRRIKLLWAGHAATRFEIVFAKRDFEYAV